MRRYNAQDGEQGGCSDVLWAGEGEATTCGGDGSRNDGEMVARHRGPEAGFAVVSFQRPLRGGEDPDRKSAASDFSQGGNEETDPANSRPVGDKRRGRCRKGAIDARRLRGGGHRRPPRRILTARSVRFFRLGVRYVVGDWWRYFGNIF